MLAGLVSFHRATYPSSTRLGLPWKVVLALLLTLAALPLLNASTARGATYPTSEKYGGANGSVDVLSEWTAVSEAMDSSSDEGNSLWFGLSPVDQEKNQVLNPVNRAATEEGFPEAATDSPFTDAGRLYDRSSENLSGGTPTTVRAPGNWCYGGLTAAGELSFPVTWLRLIDHKYAHGGASFRLGVHALSYSCGNGRTRVYFLVRANGKTLPQYYDAVRPEYQVQVVRGNGEKKSTPLTEITPDTNNLNTPYSINNGYTRFEFSQPANHSAEGLNAKEIRIPVRVLDMNEGAMKPVDLVAKFFYPPIRNPSVTRSAQEEAEQEEAAPSVETAYAEVGQTSAKLVGWLNPMGGYTHFHFLYGTTTNYGATAPAPAATMSGVKNEIVAADIANLQPNTTYHYRLEASNGQGSTVGEDKTFTTAPGYPSASTAYAEVGRTTAKLVGWLFPNNFLTSFQFEYGTTANYGNVVPVPAATMTSNKPEIVAMDIANLQPNTTYHYRLIANNAYGNTNGGDLTFTTLPGPPLVRVAPPGEVTSTMATLGSEINGEGQATTYYYEYGQTSGYGSKTAEKALPSGTGFQPAPLAVEGLPVSWTLHYRVVAKTALGTTYGSDQVITTGWRNEPTSGTEPAGSNRLNDVACAIANDCVAVGTYVSAETGATKLAASLWNGNAWAPINPPTPAGAYAELNGVSCTAQTNCLAVGHVRATDDTVRPLIMKWNGSAWSEVSAGSQLPAGKRNYLNDISCPTATSCEAVGYSTSAGGAEVVTLAMHWDGATWTRRTSANPSTQSNVLAAVSCASATFCKAVGRQYAGGYKALIENLGGSEWVAQAADTSSYPASETDFLLEGVSCPSATSCLAVGSSGAGSPQKPFTQRWDGSKWVNQPVTAEPNGATKLYDVACRSAGFCRAVGADGRVLHWTGARWRLQAPKPPTDLQSVESGTWRELNGIACPTVTDCHAVGSYVATTGQRRRLTQGWSGAGATLGASWTVATSIGENGATLNGRANSAGLDANYYFEYGPTTAYGSKTAEASAGSDNYGPKISDWPMVSTPVTGLAQYAEYHYRLVVTNGISTVYGEDTVFKTKSRLGEMPVTEPFNATNSGISDFATKWAPLAWTSTRKGKNNTDGYGPTDTAANGAYFIPTVWDGGQGLASQATIAAGPGTGGRISLWLDLTNPIPNAKYGYELALQETSAAKYTVSMKRWFNNIELLIGSEAGVSLPAGSKIALFDEGTKVSAWANTGSGFVKLLSSGTEAAYSGGAAAVEVQGATTTRLTNFKVGITNEKAASPDAALKAVPVIDDLSRDENPLSKSSSWSALAWDTAAVKTGKTVAGKGWTASEWTSAVAGAYWQKAMASDTGTGDAVGATTSSTYASCNSGCYFALWLNAPNPGSVRSGYQLRVVATGFWPLELQLVKWVNGTPTILGTKTVNFPVGGSAGAKFALVDKGTTVSVYYTVPGEGSEPYTQALSASDSTYSYGYGGIEGAMPTTVRDFRLGQVPLQ